MDKAILVDDQKSAANQWKSAPADHGQSKRLPHGHDSKPMDDQWPADYGNHKRWKWDQDQWKRRHDSHDPLPPGDAAALLPGEKHSIYHSMPRLSLKEVYLWE